MRSITDNLSWFSGFFASAPTEEKTLFLSPVIFRKNSSEKPINTDDEPTLLNYCIQKRFLKDGYTKVAFNCFDFSGVDEQHAEVLTAADQRFVFFEAVFTVEQIIELLVKKYDLSTSTYRLNKTLDINAYLKLYSIAKSNGLEKSLHSVQVYFSNENLTELPVDIVAVCHPFQRDLHTPPFQNSVISQAQFDKLIDAFNETSRHSKVLNLSGLTLNGLDLTRMIQKNNEQITFSPFNTLMYNQIILHDTHIDGATIEISALATASLSSKYFPWFSRPTLTFFLRQEDGLDDLYYRIDMKTVCDQLFNVHTARRTQLTLHSKSDFHEKIKFLLTEKKHTFHEVDFQTLQPHEKLLCLIFCVHHDETHYSLLKARFWSALPQAIVNTPLSLIINR